MGYAHGMLQKEKVSNLMNDVWKYLEEQVVRPNILQLYSVKKIMYLLFDRWKLSMELLVSSPAGF